MTLNPTKISKRTVDIETAAYDIHVPFHKSCYVSEHTLITNDELAPLDFQNVSGDFNPVPGFGALYRLIGDGVHTPTFNAAFKKSSSSGDYVNTAGVLNLITFLFDGVDYWYSIVQAQ